MKDRAVSLKAVISTIYGTSGYFKNDFDQGFFADKIKQLPSVTPTNEEMAIQYTRGYIDGFKDCKAMYELKKDMKKEEEDVI